MNIGWTIAYWILAAIIVAAYGLVADNLYTLIRDFKAGRRARLGRSTCDDCQRPLSWEMTPVLGYALCRGRCSCGLRIPRVYPIVELVGILVGAAIFASTDPFTAVWILIGYVAIASAFVVTEIALKKRDSKVR